MCRAEAAALLAGVYARMNQPVLARAQLAIAKAHPDGVAYEDLALAFAAVGDRNVALSYFHRVRGDYMQATIANDPRFDSIREDPMLAHLAQKPA